MQQCMQQNMQAIQTHLQLLHLSHVQAQLCLNACQHLLWLEGLADVVLAAGL